MGIVNRLATESYVSNEITVVQNGTDTKVEEHNTATDSHSDIRTEISSLSLEVESLKTQMDSLTASVVTVHSGTEVSMTSDVGEDGDVYLVTE